MTIGNSTITARERERWLAYHVSEAKRDRERASEQASEAITYTQARKLTFALLREQASASKPMSVDVDRWRDKRERDASNARQARLTRAKQGILSREAYEALSEREREAYHSERAALCDSLSQSEIGDLLLASLSEQA